MLSFMLLLSALILVLWRSKKQRALMGPKPNVPDNHQEALICVASELPEVSKVPKLSLLDEEREVISSLFSQPLDDETPRNT